MRATGVPPSRRVLGFHLRPIGGRWAMPDRLQKITFGEMGVHGAVVSCQNYQCSSHSLSLNAERWSDDLRLSDIEQQYVCQACGKRGADVRPDWRIG